MKKILRISLDWVDKTIVNIPVGAKILSCKVLGPTGKASVWFECDSEVIDYTDKYVFYMVGTGSNLPEVPGTVFLDTIQKNTTNDNNIYVFHVYYHKL